MFKMKKIIFGFLLFLLISVSIQTKAEAQEMFTHKPVHTIFLIHGIGGNKRHFGYMSKALPKILNAKDPETKYIVRSIEYDTGNNDKTPYDFAKDVDLKIKKTTASGRFKKEDKISLIMHSQGGLVGSIWVFQSLMKTPGYSTPETIQYLDSFITLGAPFWGAKMAQWGSEIKSLAIQLGVPVPLLFGTKELEEMSFGSDMIYDFRQAMIDFQYVEQIDYLRNNVKLLNVVGVANVLSPLGIFVSGTNGQYEDDGAVPLASARFDFLYNQSLREDYDEGDRLMVSNIKEAKLAPYVVVNAMHRSPLPEMDNFPGIPQIPKSCIKEENCKHPTFPYIWKTILGEPIEQMDETLGDFKTFLLDLNVRVESEKDFKCDDLKIEFFKRDGSVLDATANIEISKFFELYSKGQRTSQKYRNHCRYYFTGSIKKNLPHRQEIVLIKVSGTGLKTRFVEMQLKESYSSFVDINLKEKEELV